MTSSNTKNTKEKPSTSDTSLTTKKKTDGQFNRRDFLKLGGLTGAGIFLAISFADAKIISQAAAIEEGTFEPNAFLKISSNGRITIYGKNPEIGQGIKTSFAQIIAEELEVDWKQVEVEQGHLDNRFGGQFAGGSTGIKTNFDALRRAGAGAKEMLIEAAARQWRVSLDKCYAKDGFVYHTGTDRKLSYAELAVPASKLNVRENPALKDRKDYKIIGQAIRGVDNKKIATGTAEFGLDARPKGMVVAVIERCPMFGGKVKSVDDSEALKIPGVEKVVVLEPTKMATQVVGGVAVIAKNTWTAMKGRKALKIEWDMTGVEVESDEKLKAQFTKNLGGKGDILRDDGNVDEAFASCAKVHEAVFEAPFLAHVAMEPMNYIADVKADSVEVWGPTQVPGAVRGAAMEITGLAANKIKVRMTRVGGGFGRRLMADYAWEAIALSKQIGKAVQVVWSREDDIQHDFYRPNGLYHIKAGLDANNKLVAWHCKGSTTSRRAFSGATSGTHETELFPDGFPAGFIPAFRMEYTPVVSKVPRGAWRAPGHNVTAWLDQTFIDELATLAGKDPIAFRLEVLGDEDKVMPYRDHGGPVYSTARLKNVIRQTAEKSNWDKPAPKGQYRGFAAHFMFGAYVAEVVTISMPTPTTVKLENVTAVVDCGLVINKSGALNQLEGGIIDGLNAALNSAIHIENGKVKETNFSEYKMLRMKDAPTLDVHLIDSPEPPEGLGEMTLPPVAAALCNAIFAATGKRVHSLPINLGSQQRIERL
ncbi:MAG TPA: molybdopterin cofactor-binding domain-containing protein [Cyclobacteriaceae bacterium]|nr:molybdopterin cofactor-binding domain-containing protein [Cyclobacteriaceae bacterium]